MSMGCCMCICQRIKNENVHYLGLLQPLPIPEAFWKDIAMDFIEGIPIFKHKNSILIVVDKLIKWSYFMVSGKFITHLFLYTTMI